MLLFYNTFDWDARSRESLGKYKARWHGRQALYQRNSS